ncbi:MAG: CDP-alcohol phosphatidyltransferase family protein [Bacilli bacterium]|nr:CDP-alcohol phosphatidyltransferase family protein [Bacilli bacterium]
MMNILKNGLMELKTDIKEGNIKKQIANMLTLSRFFSPFILLPLYYFNKMTIFLIMIIIFSLTDTFDGYFARKYTKENLFGRYLDAVVDKIFVATLLIPLFSNKYSIIIFLFEALITGVNIYAFCNNLNPKTKYIGKIKTTFLFILICSLYLRKFIYFNNIYLDLIIIVTICLQIITVISYIVVLKSKNKTL